MRVRPVLLAAVLVSAVPTGGVVSGQVSALPDRVEPKIEPPMAVPFGPGEYLRYDVRLGFLGRRGEGYMQVVGLDSVRGRLAYHVSMVIEGGLPLARVKDHYQSWFDTQNLVTLRFIQDIDEINYERYRHYELFPEERRFERGDKDEGGDIPTSMPLDDVSFFYFVRSLPLEVGEEYTFNRYFRESGNPVILKVIRRDTVKVPAGTFPTIVVRPLIKTSGLFGQGGEAELHFSDDDRRLLVLMKSKVPLIGSLSLHLTEIREGDRLTSFTAPGGGDPPPERRPIP
jgi:hypothetical protein